MKRYLIFAAIFGALTASAMPLKWTCRFPSAASQTFSVYQGETVSFEPTFVVNGVITNLTVEGIYYQTNGMENTWWTLPNGTFGPENDIGAPAYRFFISALGDEGRNYRANGTLRMLNSPGFVPNTIALPTKILDFADIEVRNEPWADQTAVNTAIAESREAQSLVHALSTIVMGDDAQLISTNYDSKVHMPSLFLRFQIPNEESGTNEWHVVWNEMTRWNWFLDGYLPTNYFNKTEIAAELDQKADRAWGYYDSHSGNYAPEGFTWVSSPSIAIAGGLAYQRFVTTQGAIWVLESNGMTTITGGETNGFFRISDDKGNSLFEITKGTEVLAGATAGKVTTSTVDGITHLHIVYNVESSTHPTIEVCSDLKNPEWAAETDDACKANVVWSGTSGNYTAEVWGKSVYNSLFVRASYKKGTRDIIKNSAPVGFSEIYIDGQTYKVSVGTIDGKKVLVLE